MNDNKNERQLPEDLVRTIVSRIGNYMPALSVYDVKKEFCYALEKAFNDPRLNKTTYLEGVVKSPVRYYNMNHFVTFRLVDKNGNEVSVFVPGMEKLKSHIEPGQLIGVKGTLHFYKDALWKGLDFLQIKALEVKKVGFISTDYEPLIQFVAKNKIKKNISFWRKKIFKIGLITSQYSEAVNDIHTCLNKHDVFHIEHIYTNLYDSEKIAETINEADIKDYDALLLARGGTEKVEIFNDYRILNSIYNCNTLVISAIGHASSIPLSNFLSDIAEDTPSAAAKYLELNYLDFKRNRNNVKVAVALLILIIIYILSKI